MPVDPPSVTRDADLTARLLEALHGRGDGYVPRTHLVDEGGAPRYVNRLILEASPYLVQHAHNPVDWRPWGEAAFEEAAARDCPVFLSVGYATCHWCHVMEEESFDDEEVAAALNAGFVAVKLDREVRPDLDQIYITATQLQHGHAGWPNSVWLRPDGLPFHTGTYFPKRDFLRVLAAVAEAWTAQRPEIDRVAGQIAGAVRRQSALAGEPGAMPGEDTFAAAVAQLSNMHNSAHGGFSQNQQFPQEGFLSHLLDRWRRDGDATALEIAGRSLEAIAAGGIHDHAGGGFHRYTVDVTWRTPHFEKMLYNQGLLVRAFVEGWEATGHPGWRRAAERACGYVLREMTDEGGAFYAAEDADSLDAEGRRAEGAFYIWEADEARAALLPDGSAAAAWAVSVLGLEKPIGEVGPVAHLEPGRPVDAARLDPLLERLRQAREARPRPIRDDKVIAGWNGLMIRALAEAGTATENEAFAAAAARAAEAVWSRLWNGTRLSRLWADGQAREAGQLEDYAWLGLGFLALDEAAAFALAPEGVWRGRAEALAAAMLRDFADGTGRLKMAAEDGPLGPIHETSDGATPAGESSALELLARLAALSPASDAGAAAHALAARLGPVMRDIPLLRVEALSAARLLAEGRSTMRRRIAQGAVALRLSPEGPVPGAVVLEVATAPGWHLTAADPGADGLSPARAEGAEIDWPEGTALSAGFSEAPLRVYEGRLRLRLRPTAPVLTLHLQACSQTVCAAPERVVFRLPTHALSEGTGGASHGHAPDQP